MEKREKPIPEYKVKAISELVELAKKKNTILVASIKNIPGNQFQEIVKKLRGKAIVKVPKKNLIFKALEQSGKEASKLKKKINDSVAILFSDLDSFDLAGELLSNTSPARAKAGQEAPEDIEVEAGPTEMVPGPAISELGALGIQVQIEKGKISIKESKVIVKAGQKISQGAADIMGKLDIKPFKIGFVPLCAYDSESGKLYESINIDREGTLNELKNAYGRASPFAVSIGYTSKDTVGFLLAKGAAHANKLNRIVTGEPEPVAEVVQEAQTQTEEKKEEPKANAGEGLASLFG